ncbi:hypothetical protein BS50DRAFT_243610 [Corynespora cassiicola Philippines]|uniref:Uncharacterized protein n=1 Tax=Corynespora cassiicola Philippines TaxID=1448308 RepID=A0A2T2P376_CORCC|nr:hypothetical protein BS50DRAFT_243610 [Corynespora cassiicola Philippines]
MGGYSVDNSAHPEHSGHSNHTNKRFLPINQTQLTLTSSTVITLYEMKHFRSALSCEEIKDKSKGSFFEKPLMAIQLGLYLFRFRKRYTDGKLSSLLEGLVCLHILWYILTCIFWWN